MRTMNKSIWPYQVKMSARDDWNEILCWCDANIKNRYYVNNNTFCFTDEKESLLFNLRWA
jgi:hypothetical protein